MEWEEGPADSDGIANFSAGEARDRGVREAEGALRRAGRPSVSEAGGREGSGELEVEGRREGLVPDAGVEKPESDNFGRAEGVGDDRAIGL